MFRHFRLGVFVAATIMLTGCFGLDRLDRQSVRNVDPETSPMEGQSIVAGSVRFIANSQPVRYNVLRRPIFRLVRREDFLHYITPQTDSGGNFLWALPYGSYDVEVLTNMIGYSPERALVQPSDPSGSSYFTSGFVRPGLSFTVAPGEISYLGTLVVDVNVSEPNVFGDTIFQSLNGMRIVNDASRDPNWQAVRHKQNASVQLFQRTSRKRLLLTP